MKKYFLFILCCNLVLASCISKLTNQTINKKREGLWIEKNSLDSSNYKSVGHYKNDDPIKKWHYYLDGKIIKKEKYKKSYCKTKRYHENGKLQSKGKTVLDTSGKYAHWYYNEEWKFYDDNGKLQSRRMYQEGELKAEQNTIKN